MQVKDKMEIEGSDCRVVAKVRKAIVTPVVRSPCALEAREMRHGPEAANEPPHDDQSHQDPDSQVDRPQAAALGNHPLGLADPTRISSRSEQAIRFMIHVDRHIASMTSTKASRLATTMNPRRAALHRDRCTAARLSPGPSQTPAGESRCGLPGHDFARGSPV